MNFVPMRKFRVACYRYSTKPNTAFNFDNLPYVIVVMYGAVVHYDNTPIHGIWV